MPETWIDPLVREHAPALLGYTTRLTGGDRGLAEDLVQETFLRAWRHPGHLAPERGPAGPWLRRIAHNLAVDGHRRRGARPRETELGAPEALPATAEDHGDRVVSAEHVRRMLQPLSPAHREVVELLYLHDLTCRQAAARLGVPVGTVKSRLHHALRALRAGAVPAAGLDAA